MYTWVLCLNNNILSKEKSAMARGINKAILIGNLGADPEVRYMPNGNAVTTISLATSEQWKDRETGSLQERTEWHRVVFFNRLAEIAGEFLKKGSKVYVEGSIRTRKWQDKNGQDKYSTEIIGNEMQMLDSRGSSANSEHTPPTHEEAPKNNPTANTEDSFDDDIPF